MRRTSLFAIVAAIGLVLSLSATSANAQVRVIRTGEENPVKTIAKSTFWGAVTGLALGAAVALVAEENEEDIMKWFFVGGVFGGFGFGVYHVLTREPPSSGVIDDDDEGFGFGLPTLRVGVEEAAGRRSHRVDVTLVTLGF